MSFIITFLQTMGLVTQARAPAKENPFSAAPRKPKRSVSLGELSAQDSQQGDKAELQALRESAGLTVSLAEIFVMAKLEQPEHGVTIMRLSNIAHAALEKGPQAAEDELTIEIAAAGMTIDDTIEDAIRHDEMLDLYDEAVGTRVERLVEQLADESGRLEAEIERLTERLATRQQRAEELRGAYQEWRDKKRGVEQRWADTMALLVKQDVISPTKMDGEEGEAAEPAEARQADEPDEPNETDE